MIKIEINNRKGRKGCRSVQEIGISLTVINIPTDLSQHQGRWCVDRVKNILLWRLTNCYLGWKECVGVGDGDDWRWPGLLLWYLHLVSGRGGHSSQTVRSRVEGTTMTWLWNKSLSLNIIQWRTDSGIIHRSWFNYNSLGHIHVAVTLCWM